MRAHSLNRLKAIQLRKLSPGRLNDGGGLYLITKKQNDKVTSAWVFRYKKKGKEKTVGLGSLSFVTLAQARDKRDICIRAVLENSDVKFALAGATVAEDTDTFRRVAQQWIEATSPSWTPDYKKGIQSRMSRYVYPVIGDRLIADLTRLDIHEVLKPIWLEIHVTATKIRQNIEAVFDYARTLNLFAGDNPALWRGGLSFVLPTGKKIHATKNHEAMDFHRLPAFMAFLQERAQSRRSPTSSKALIWLILTTTRYSETSGAVWDEIDIDRKVWTIPAERMKAGVEHSVPLTPPLIDLFYRLKDESKCQYLFPGVGREDLSFQPMSENTMTCYLQDHAPVGKPTTHGFRGTFKTWALEKGDCPEFLSEEQLAHAYGDAVRNAYVHSDLIRMRRELMEKYADFATSTTRAAKVISIA